MKIMVKNTNLRNANKAKNDEFYTRLEDIEKELNEYDPKVFKDKTIYCNCDDPTRSNFWVFFHVNFNRLGLKKLIATHYNMDGSPSYAMTYDSKDPKDDIDLSKGTKIPLKGNGDFRSGECIDLLKQSDMVVSNPPFSLFRTYIDQLEQYHKKFIVIGSNNAVAYKKIFTLIKDNKLWLGFSQPKKFVVPNGTIKGVAAYWFTNIDPKKDVPKLETVYRWRERKEKYPDLYPKYDNYDAIEVGRTMQIPLDYDGVMGVPISFLEKFNPDQFEIIGADETVGVGMSNGLLLKNSKHDHPCINGKAKYKRIFIKNKHPEDYQNDL